MEELTLTTILLLGLIQLFAQGLEAVTGFGSTVIAVPLMAMFTDLDTAKAVGVTHTWLLVIYIVIVSWKNIVWKEFRFIILHVLIGLPFGFLLYGKLDSTYLMAILALFMIGVGINGIYTTRRNRRQAVETTEPVKKSLLMRFILFLGGIIHGAFGTGGPLIVIYAAQALKDKTLFRTCLCLLWLCLNTVLLFQFTISGTWMTKSVVTVENQIIIDDIESESELDKPKFGFESIKTRITTTWHKMQNNYSPLGVAMVTLDPVEVNRVLKSKYIPLYATIVTLPFLLIGIMVGNYLHHRCSEYVFRLIMFALLFGTGIVVMYDFASKVVMSG